MTRRRSDDAVADAFRDEWGRVVATLIRFTGDWDLAEECAQDAFALGTRTVGARRRPAQSRRVADHDREEPGNRPRCAARRPARPSSGRWRCSRSSAAGRPACRCVRGRPRSGIEDDRLRLIFTCCHPALSVEAQVASDACGPSRV